MLAWSLNMWSVKESTHNPVFSQCPLQREIIIKLNTRSMLRCQGEGIPASSVRKWGGKGGMWSCGGGYNSLYLYLKGVFAKNEKGFGLTAKNKRFWSLLILLLSVASIRRKLLKTTHTEECSIHTNSENCNIQLRS